MSLEDVKLKAKEVSVKVAAEIQGKDLRNTERIIALALVTFKNEDIKNKKAPEEPNKPVVEKVKKKAKK